MNLKFRGEDIEVVYETYGQYFHATRETPEEYPDIFITEVMYKGVDINPILGDGDVEEIEGLLLDAIYG